MEINFTQLCPEQGMVTRSETGGLKNQKEILSKERTHFHFLGEGGVGSCTRKGISLLCMSSPGSCSLQMWQEPWNKLALYQDSFAQRIYQAIYQINLYPIKR